VSECKVERFLTENPPNEDNIETMQKELRPEAQTLQELINENTQVAFVRLNLL